MALGDRVCGAATWADYDNDGRPEIVVNNFNDQPYYLQNVGPRKPQSLGVALGSLMPPLRG